MKNRVPFTGRACGGRPALSGTGRWSVLATLAVGWLSGSAVQAQSPVPEVIPAYARAVIDGTVTADPNLQQAGCATCGGSPLPNIVSSAGGFGGEACACSPGETCNSCRCKPGKPGSVAGCLLNSCPPDHCVGRFLHGVAKCICCPDPCYQPVWVTTANSAFFMDTVRPRTYTRLGWDLQRNFTQLDRAEFMFAKLGGRGLPNTVTKANFDDLVLYQEVASGAFGAFFSTSYRSIYPDQGAHHANFGDLTAGTKSLLVDCELWQLGFQFKTYIPAGNSRNGLGTGHVSLEPSLLSSIKVNPDVYVQSQVAYWIPVGGDPAQQGATWHYHMSLNALLCKWSAWQLISTTEINGWSFTDGLVTNPGPPSTVVKASGENYLTAGGGLRLVFCEDYDIGFAMTRALTDDHFARELYRFEFRKRY